MAIKRTKIKRYGNIYGRGMGAGSWYIVVAMVVGVLLFGVIGWSLYTPVHEFVMKLGTEEASKPATSSSVAPLPGSSTVSQPSETPDLSGQEETSKPGSSAQAESEQKMQGIYLPVTQLMDDTVFSGMLSRAAAAQLNTVVVDAKDATGKVLFSSQNAVAQKAGAADDTAYAAKRIADNIKAQGMVPAARLHAFRDSITPLNEREMAVHYYDTEVFWYDNAPEQGGKPWLNPYSPAAQQYIISLAEELCSQGFEIILLDSVQFPSGVGLNKAGYGPDAKSVSRAETLKLFVQKISAAVKAKGGKLIICTQDDWMPVEDEALNNAVTARNSSYYGGEPAAFFTDRVMITLSSDTTVWKTILNKALISGNNTGWIGVIPAYAADGTLSDCSALIAAYKTAGGDNYVLYNPQGNYKLQ